MKKLTFILAIMAAFPPWTGLHAKTWIVGSGNSFYDAHVSAAPSDTIAWVEGVFNNVFMGISKSSLVVMARTPGRTVFTGSSKVLISGSDNTFSGFQYLDGNIGTDVVIQVTGSRNHLTQLNIRDYTCTKYLVIEAGCSHNEVSYSNLEHRANMGNFNILSILVEDRAPAYHTIRYCSFKNFDGTGGDMGVEPIRIGLSTQGDFISRSVVEYCYFTQCNGDGEIISNKSRQNVYRYNTFYDNPLGELVLRHGDEGVVYGNFFLNGKGGIRVKEGQHHVIFNNYFSGLTSSSIQLQNYEVDPLDSILIAYNTILNSARSELGSSGANPPKHVTFANNIFSNSSGPLFTEATGTETWIGNLSKGTLGIIRPEGITDTDPKLVLNSEGFYGPGAGSPAIDSAQPGYPPLPGYPGVGIDHDVLLDLMKQSRPANIMDKDVGCSEYPLDSLIRPHAGLHNTGPAYIRDQDLVYLKNLISGPGRIVPDPAGWVYERGTRVVLTAVPDSFCTFKEWGGELSGTTLTDSLVMNSSTSVTAYFNPPKEHKITIFISGQGKVEFDPAGPEYTAGTLVTISALPDPGYAFSHWSGQIQGSENPLEWLVTEDMAGIANFVLSEDTVTDLLPRFMQNDATLEIFPNPSTGMLSVILKQEGSTYIDLAVFDLAGRSLLTIHSGSVPAGRHRFEANLSSLEPGFYVVGLKRPGRSSKMIRILKQ